MFAKATELINKSKSGEVQDIPMEFIHSIKRTLEGVLPEGTPMSDVDKTQEGLLSNIHVNTK